MFVFDEHFPKKAVKLEELRKSFLRAGNVKQAVARGFCRYMMVYPLFCPSRYCVGLSPQLFLIIGILGGVMALLFKKKNQENAEPMDLEAVMKKYDQESNVRIWEGKARIAVNAVLAIFSLFCIYVTLFFSFLQKCGIIHYVIKIRVFHGYFFLVGYRIIQLMPVKHKIPNLSALWEASVIPCFLLRKHFLQS